MDEGKRSMAQRLAQAQSEGHDNLGAFELTLGGAILVGYLLFSLLDTVTVLAWLVFCLLFVGGLWYGGALEYRQLRALGRRRVRGTLLLLITWLTVGLALLLAGLLVALARLLEAGSLYGWLDRPILMTLFFGLYHLSQGVRLGVPRWMYLGGALCLLGAMIPGVRFLRHSLYLTCALLLGGPLLVSGYLGRRTFLRQLRAAQSLRGPGEKTQPENPAQEL